MADVDAGGGGVCNASDDSADAMKSKKSTTSIAEDVASSGSAPAVSTGNDDAVCRQNANASRVASESGLNRGDGAAVTAKGSDVSAAAAQPVETEDVIQIEDCVSLTNTNARSSVSEAKNDDVVEVDAGSNVGGTTPTSASELSKTASLIKLINARGGSLTATASFSSGGSNDGASTRSTANNGKTSNPNVVTIDDFKTLHKLASSSRKQQLDKARKRFNDLASSTAAFKNRFAASGSGVTITPACKSTPSSSSSSPSSSTVQSNCAPPSVTVSPLSVPATNADTFSPDVSSTRPVSSTPSALGNDGSKTANSSNDVILDDNFEIDAKLTDDTCVVEAPSFIVPYVYERPPSVKFAAFSDGIRKIMARRRRKEAAAASKADKESENGIASEKQDASDDKDDAITTDASGVQKGESSKSDQVEGHEEDDCEDEDDDVIDLDDQMSDIEAKSQPHTDNYFESSLGSFFVDLGASLVQEFVQTDLLAEQVKKSRKDKSASVMHSIVSLKKSLEQGRQRNEPFHLRELRCKICTFRTESDVVLQHHLETPHVRNFAYKCNFCSFEVRNPHDILTHVLVKHGVRARLERPPAMHQCTFCLFEDNMKGKVTRHIKACERRFNRLHNQAPPYDWDSPAKVAKPAPLPPVVNSSTMGSITSVGAGPSQQMTPQQLIAHYQQQQVLQQQQQQQRLLAERQQQQMKAAIARAKAMDLSMMGGGQNNLLSPLQQQQLAQLQKMQHRTSLLGNSGRAAVAALSAAVAANSPTALQQYQQQLASCVANLISAGQQKGVPANSSEGVASALSSLSRLTAAAPAAAPAQSKSASANKSSGQPGRQQLQQAGSKSTTGNAPWQGRASSSPSEMDQQSLSRLLLASKLSKMTNASQRALLVKQLEQVSTAGNNSPASAILNSLSANSSVTIQSVNGGSSGGKKSSGTSSASGNNSGSSVSLLSGKPSISITPLPSYGNTGSSDGKLASQRTSSGGGKVAPATSSAAGQQAKGVHGFVVCEVCDGYVKDLEQLRHHMLFMHKVKIHPKMIHNRPPLNCQKCQYRFFTDQGLERHLLGSHGLVTASMQEMANGGKDAGRCPVCGKAFTAKLLSHVTTEHKITLKPAHLSYKCTVCTATFGQYKLFENHVYQAHSAGAASLKRQAGAAASNEKSTKAARMSVGKAGAAATSTSAAAANGTGGGSGDDVIELDSDDDADVKSNGGKRQINGGREIQT